MTQDAICTVPANLLLGVAQRLFSYDKTPLALALIHVVLEQRPEYAPARSMYEDLTGRYPSEYPLEKHTRVKYDFEKQKFSVCDALGGNCVFFEKFEDAEAYVNRF